MAIVVGPFYRALDDNNVLVPSAQLRVRTAGSAVLAVNIYSDSAMTIQHANPVQADAAGWFPLIYSPSGQKFDVAILTSIAAGGAVVHSFLNQESVGSDTGALTRDFTTSRARIAASTGGVTSFEAGDPTGDDVGGKVRVGGYSDSQADTISLDGAATNTTGTLTVRSKKLLGLVETPAVTFTAASTVDIPLTNTPTGVLAWEVDLWDFLTSATANLYARFSYDGGGTFKAGATDYYGHFIQLSAASSAATADLTEAQMELCSNLVGSAARPGFGKIRIITPNGAGAVSTRLSSQLFGQTQTPVLASVMASGFGIGSYGRATHLRLLASSGTITGKYRVTPLYGFGET